ncbi:MAG: efflux family protein [Anaerocolumna sp.]|nr:efflux family protein [Anaerocolumna sp.]
MATTAEKRRQEILEGSLLRIILILAVPVMIDNLMNAVFGLIDTYFVSSIGLNEVAAVTFVGPIYDMVRAIGVGISITGTIMIGRAIGKADKEEEKTVAKYLMIIAFAAGIFITGYIFIRWEAILISAAISDSLLPIAGDYFRMTTLSTPLILINAVYIGQKRAEGDTARILKINSLSIVIKIILTYVLIYIFKLGLISLAITTFVSQIYVTLYAIFQGYLGYMVQIFKYKASKFRKDLYVKIFKIGLPSVIEKASLSYGFVLVNEQVIKYGEGVLAAYGITNKINSVLFSTVSGIGTGLAIVITQNLARKQLDRVKSAIRISLIFAVIFSTVVGIVLLIFKYPIAAQMTRGDADVLMHTLNAMSVFSISVVPWAIFQVILGVFQGYGRTKYNLYISFIRVYLLRLPIVLLLVYLIPGIREFSIWYGMLLSNIFTAVVSIGFYVVLRYQGKLNNYY